MVSTGPPHPPVPGARSPQAGPPGEKGWMHKVEQPVGSEDRFRTVLALEDRFDNGNCFTVGAALGIGTTCQAQSCFLDQELSIQSKPSLHSSPHLTQNQNPKKSSRWWWWWAFFPLHRWPPQKPQPRKIDPIRTQIAPRQARNDSTRGAHKESMIIDPLFSDLFTKVS